MEVYGLQIIVFIDYLVGRLDKQVGLRFIYRRLDSGLFILKVSWKKLSRKSIKLFHC